VFGILSQLGADMKKLSDKQNRIMKFLNSFIKENGYPPAIRDIQAGCGISSTSVVDYNLNILEKEGYIHRHAEVSRGITVVNRDIGVDSTVSIPVIGLIAAGEPIPVPAPDTWDVSATSETMQVPCELTRNREDIYALRVKGMSMVDALINDGDIILMQYVSSVENGEMAAVWLKADKEVTLKKVYVEPDRIRLQPANSEMRPIYTDHDNVEVQGKVIAVLRQIA
jgi:repressor LexA